MAIIFCDTDSELYYTHANKFDLQVIRMPYSLDGEEKLADLGETFDPKQFFGAMRDGAKASTAGLNEETYYEIFKPFFEKGEDILYIAFSSQMSKTFDYLAIAINRLKTEYPNVKYLQFDTLNICIGTGILVYLGAKYCREHGDDIEATYEYLESLRDRVGIYFTVENMKYLARGGRISPAKAKIGNLMNIKPVLTVIDGKLDVCQKCNGLKKAIDFMFKTFEERYDPSFDAPIVVLDADNPQPADDIISRVKEKYPNVEIWHNAVGPVIGAHAGPGTIGLVYIAKK